MRGSGIVDERHIAVIEVVGYPQLIERVKGTVENGCHPRGLVGGAGQRRRRRWWWWRRRWRRASCRSRGNVRETAEHRIDVQRSTECDQLEAVIRGGQKTKYCARHQAADGRTGDRRCARSTRYGCCHAPRSGRDCKTHVILGRQTCTIVNLRK